MVWDYGTNTGMGIMVWAYYTVTGNCGKIGVLGSGIEHDCAGLVEDSFELRIGKSAKFMYSALQVIEHPFPIFLLDTNVLCWGQKASSWNYEVFPSRQTLGLGLFLGLLVSGMSLRLSASCTGCIDIGLFQGSLVRGCYSYNGNVV